MNDLGLKQAPLGKKSEYIHQYDASLLVPIARTLNRNQLPIDGALPFTGFDIWNAFELSWLNKKNKPQVALAQFVFPCESEFLIESKSFKLYLNSFNNTQFDSAEKVRDILERDLSNAAKTAVQVKLISVDEEAQIARYQSICLDNLDVEGVFDHVHPEFLRTESVSVEETVHSNLLKSNCLVTGQPDWGSVEIKYRGKKIDHAGLLQYLISFRNHNEFHEHCVERIFVDIWQRCSPEFLEVYARYTRRGGLDINPVRTSETCNVPSNIRLIRQ